MKSLKSFLLNDIWSKAFILLAVFIGAYWIPLRAIVGTWLNNEDYSYGFLIPLVSAYLLWEKRQEIKDMPVRSSWSIFPFLLVFVLISLYGILGSSGNVSMPAIPVLIILFFAFCYGLKAAKRLLLPLGFLVFMVPIPPVLERYIGIYLKSISSVLGGAMISLFDIPVHVSGNIIDLGVTQLQVVDACSGMRYISALLALGVVYAYFFEKVSWKRIFVVLATIPIGVLTNALRIGITGILTEKYGAKMAEGFFHGFSGWALFMVAFAFLFLLGRILSFFPPKGSNNGALAPLQETKISSAGKVAGNINRAFYVSIFILCVVGILSLSTSVLPALKIRGGLESFPLDFAGWSGKSEIVPPEIVRESGAEESFSGVYAKGDRDVVSLYVGYRSTAFLSNENFFHSPTVCLPSSGWKVLGESVHTIDHVPQFNKIEVTTMVIESMDKKELVYFWFQTKDKATKDKNIHRFHLSLHALQRDNTHALFIRPITAILPGESMESAEKRMDRFVRDMMKAMLLFLKEKQYEEKGS